VPNTAVKPRVGIIGLGFGAQVHLPAFQSEGWEVAALCSRHRDKAQKVADGAGVEAVYTDPLELIRRDDIAAVAISTPPRTHHPLVMAALEAGKHVLCEKPLALSPEEVDAIKDAARKHGCVVMEAFMYRHHPQTLKVHELVKAGSLGSLKLIRGSFSYMLAREVDVRLDPVMGGCDR